MKKIWEFFENMNEYVYVLDMDTYELIYMNKKALDNYKISSIKEIEGRKCYDVLHNCFNPCATCNNDGLVPGYFKEWQYYSPVICKHMMLKDTMIEEDGRRYKVEIVLGTDAHEWQNTMIESYQNLELFVNEAIKAALLEESPDKSIQVALEYLGKALNGERVYIFQKNEKGGDDNTFEWVASGVTPEKDNLQDVPKEVCADWYKKFNDNRNIVIEDLEDIRESAPLTYGVLKRQNIHSLAVVALCDENSVIGFYGIDNPPGKYLNYASNMLEIMGHFIVASLKRMDLMKQLKDMSYRDHLTRIGNRHAMNEYVLRLKDTLDIGVVYCDITGLKKVNDTEGHEAGDRLIIRACESLKKTFGEYGLFRIGGDELLVLCPGIDKSELDERIAVLKKVMLENSVNMAVGSIWRSNSKIYIDKFLAEAEKLMYEDKEKYYMANGIERRKY